jgi:general secretion pathway protein N
MNAADQRRLTPWLALIVGTLAALLTALALGIGRGVEWLPPLEAQHSSATVTSSELPNPPPLEAYANTWQQPLFSPDRQVDQKVAAPGQPTFLTGYVLTGIILTDSLQLALLKDTAGKSISVVKGKPLPNGWTLESVQANKATFVSGERRQSLPLVIEKAVIEGVSTPTADTLRSAPESPPTEDDDSDNPD